ncbi:MAG: SLC13 family permease [Melioribacteraceae bacterium]|nr:MAG: SLC13 family permease [Melioribacteraceae bacterium]
MSDFEQENSSRTFTQNFGLVTGLVASLLAYLFIEFDSSNTLLSPMASIAILMAVWWITEAIPLAATALIPIALFPLLGVLNGEETATSYINSTIFLFLGGFLIALAMEKWNLHKRIALKIIRLFGGKPNYIILGFMIASAFLSMWISNTATAVMMLPIGLSILIQLEEEFDVERTHKFSVALMLGIGYSCSIGGIATIIGTPPNLSFTRILKIVFPEAPEISFGDWMMLGLPITIIMLTVAWIMLTKIYFKFSKDLVIDTNIIKKEQKQIGRMQFEEKVVAFVFAITALLWVFRSDLQLGITVIPGWSNLFGNPGYINDGTIAIGMSIILFIFPTRKSVAKSKTVLDGSVFKKVPWGIILLFGGGFALAKGFVTSGLSEYIGSSFAGLGNISPIILIILVALFINFLTELTSNTATTEMILPILASVSVAIGINPLLLMITATLSASMAFMLPVATPPNAIIFGSQRVKIHEMVKAGFALNIIGVIVVAAVVLVIGVLVFNIDLEIMPHWAK